MIEFQNVTKKFGSTTALENISLKIPESGIYCLLGRNGAGKTTFMKMLAGYIVATSGKILVQGKSVNLNKMPDVSYIENGSPHFNMPVSKLIQTASQVQDNFDIDFANKLVARLELKKEI